MALFYECIQMCAQKLLDSADIVRDGDVSAVEHCETYTIQEPGANAGENPAANLNDLVGASSNFEDILAILIECNDSINNVGSQARVDFGGANQPKARRKGAEHADYRL